MVMDFGAAKIGSVRHFLHRDAPKRYLGPSPSFLPSSPCPPKEILATQQYWFHKLSEPLLPIKEEPTPQSHGIKRCR